MGGTNSPSGCHLCKWQEKSLRVLRIFGLGPGEGKQMWPQSSLFPKCLVLKKIYKFPRLPLNFTFNDIHTHSLPQKKMEEEASQDACQDGVKRWGHGLASEIVPGLFLHRLTKARGALAIEPVRQMLQLLMFPMLTLNLISHYMIFKPQRMWNRSSFPV